MITIPNWVKEIDGWKGLGIAAGLILLAVFVLGRGLLASIAWGLAIIVLIVTVINYLSYGPGGQ